ncbi:MAG: nucleoside deaminase [Planctomycetes bacterium]|nr:nucleoside deaminase [Planctomycetota bacterium]
MERDGSAADRSLGSVKVASDREGLELALVEARAALALDEVPVGAIVVIDGLLVARGHNRTRTDCDPTAHAEVLALRRAAAVVGAARLVGATVYTTVEPCFMCAGALSHARVARVVWSVRDPKFGGVVSLGNVLTDPRMNHRCQTAEGECADEVRALLRGFFEDKRRRARESTNTPDLS